jgi:predicted  nucleic acid-binding Zn-ribbon protein
MKSITSISLDSQLKRFAQQANINVSNLTNSLLRSMMNKELSSYDGSLKELRAKIKKIDDELERLHDERAELYLHLTTIEENVKLEEQKQLERLDVIEKSIKNSGMLRKTV